MKAALLSSLFFEGKDKIHNMKFYT